ncbi:MAG: aldehyde reductase [Alphaproteobacteria bacterium]|nr:aldehyde reductase [Alphaproteobacteria bacterium]
MPTPTHDTSKPVLVTGATGFLAGWLVKRLLEEGFTVHAAVRDPANEAKIAHLKKLADELPGTIRFFEADLLNDGSYGDAMKDCSIVFHTASPFITSVEDPQRDLVDPAVNGTRNVLASANQTDSVERVVVTSSCAAMFGDVVDVTREPGGILTENVWNTTSSLGHQPYSYSKTQAERAAWEMANNQDRWKLVTINPAFILGPSISGTSTSESHNLMRQLGDGTMKSGVPPFQIGMVDVRDVAEAHMRAAFLEDAEGRYIVFGDSHSLLEVAQMLQSGIGGTWPFPSRSMPKWLVWLIGPMVDKQITRPMVAKNMGYPWHADNSRSKRELGIEYGPVSTAVTDMFQQMVDTGAVKTS